MLDYSCLNGDWEMRRFGTVDLIKSQVPGSVMFDLLNGKLMEDQFIEIMNRRHCN